jgi:hypothetical protein
MPPTEAKKRALKKWRESHKEHYNTKQNEYSKKYYEQNRDAKLEYAKQYRLKQKELKNQQLEIQEINI